MGVAERKKTAGTLKHPGCVGEVYIIRLGEASRWRHRAR